MITPRRRTLGALLAAAVVALAILPAAAASAATSYVPISGAGSSWSSNAIQQWAVNVQQYGMRVNYASTGSSDGRNQFKAGTVDFAVSEIPYGITDGGVTDAPPTVGYAYMPIVAGGTSFMYNLSAGGKQVTNLRLSGATLTGIFTGTITSWDDPKIKADNPGLDLPKRQIVPVVRSDGSGSTAQFTTWMSKKYPSAWNAYCKQAGRPLPCGITSNYPVIPGKGFIAQPNSQGVSGYVAQKANVGTITYVEYSYALKTGYPVAKILNKASYYVEPTASNVAVGLLAAKINQNKASPQYLTQILDGVYDNPDPRAYPLSSYSYMIIPTSTATNFTTAKGKTLGAFSNYFLCEGQQQAEVLGYSPLPINLVQAGLDQVKRIPGVVATAIDIKKCNNPTFSSDGTNTLAKNAPQPSPCDKLGATQCTTGTGGAKASTPTQAGSSASSSGSTGAVASTTGSSTGTKATAGSTATAGATAAAGSGGTGSGTTGSGSGTGSASTVNALGDGSPVQCDADSGVCQNVAALPVSVSASSGWTPRQSLMVGAVAALLGLVVVPPLVGLLLSRRRVRR
ncbi:phosphate ABC transporter substrate-binding protein PstS [Frondihabitans australicus]|uniref:Phosphate ABC transporter substrate-binding protein (PhoT family) n=1 Tax=Frondihabitans australicus TaxID=386892 RepID=A0A495IDG9_9MICO|nr:phosphate ABC transporter substrate-binding protein PstS [Frondihabitans australicus]RKR73165.1 phosphate ABC transporter substrate-binding protein (PhoT family) [Frondihabitans australicus]